MSILSFVLGDFALGIFAACVYVGTIIIRQVFEPRIVGKQLGLYPLATMIAMCAGYRMFGLLGLLGGPILLNLVKVVLAADRGSVPDPTSPAAEPPIPTPEAENPAAPHGEHTLPNGIKRPYWTRSDRR